jgi:glycosyltransferase involved in cell wall biosynthesis
MPKKIKLLLVSYLFPPAGGISVQRALSMARYLPAMGFEVHVLCASNAASPVYDQSLLKLVPADVRVHGSWTPEPPFKIRHAVWSLFASGAPVQTGMPAPAPGRLKTFVKNTVKRLLCPEPEILWIPFALRKARKIVRRFGIDAVLVTAPPFSAFLVGVALKREFPHLRLISDFRDEWLGFYLSESDFQSGEYTRLRATEIERETVECSDLVVAVTHSSLTRIKARYPHEADDKFKCIHNGFDPAQFQAFNPRSHKTGKIVVTHVGTATKASSPRFYVGALEALSAAIRSKVETRFIGRITDAERAVLETENAEIRLLGFMPQNQAIRYMEETDFLLMTMTDGVSLPGKLFEYLATGKPIIAISPDGGEVQRILAETQAGWCVDPNNLGNITALLDFLFSEGSPATTLHPNWDVINSYERTRKVGRLAEAIHHLYDKSLTPNYMTTGKYL